MSLFSRVKTDVKRDPLDVTLEIALSRDGKKIARVDGKPVRPSGLNDCFFEDSDLHT